MHIPINISCTPLSDERTRFTSVRYDVIHSWNIGLHNSWLLNTSGRNSSIMILTFILFLFNFYSVQKYHRLNYSLSPTQDILQSIPTQYSKVNYNKKAMLSQRWPRDVPYNLPNALKIFGESLDTPMLPFATHFNGLLFGWTLRIYQPS